MQLETDYLVIGAGATGMAFTDELIVRDRDAEVVMVDRRDRPGGHWNDAYPFVRLHQPAAFYGVNSRMLGTDAIELSGPNAGMYEQSNAGEICDYFHRVLTETLLPSRRVRFLGKTEHRGEVDGAHQLVSCLDGDTTAVRVRRSVVDATYQETAIPKTHRPGFRVSPTARCIPVNDLVSIDEPPARFVLVGAGKTAMDAGSWLLRHDIDPAKITWIRPRDAWLLNREWTQPLDQVSSLVDAVSRDLEACADAATVGEVFDALERCGRLLRLDPDVRPTMYRCATVSQVEVDELRAITDVVRLGRVQEIGDDEIRLEQGNVPTHPDNVHVDCTAGGLRTSAARPVFAPGRITLQQMRTCQPTFNAAVIAYVEATRDGDDEKNELCPPNRYPDTDLDMLHGILAQQRATNIWNSTPDMLEWMGQARLNAVRSMNDHLGEPRMQEALGRYLTSIEPAMENIARLVAAGSLRVLGETPRAQT
jgi:hypothetical protein